MRTGTTTGAPEVVVCARALAERRFAMSPLYCAEMLWTPTVDKNVPHAAVDVAGQQVGRALARELEERAAAAIRLEQCGRQRASATDHDRLQVGGDVERGVIERVGPRQVDRSGGRGDGRRRPGPADAADR